MFVPAGLLTVLLLAPLIAFAAGVEVDVYRTERRAARRAAIERHPAGSARADVDDDRPRFTYR